MGRYQGGLYRYNGRGFQHLERKDGVPRGSINALLATAGGLWIGANGGLGHVVNTAEEHPRIEIYDTARGMASDTVNCMWKTGATAFTRARPRRGSPGSQTGYIRHFSSGLAHGECQSAVRDGAGSLWFATKQGLSRLIPAEDRPPVSPRVFITELQGAARRIRYRNLGRRGCRGWNYGRRRTKCRSSSSVLITSRETSCGIRRLDGADSDWSPPRNQLTGTYPALSGGRYRFSVKAVTSEGVESAAPGGIDSRCCRRYGSGGGFRVGGGAGGCAGVCARPLPGDTDGESRTRADRHRHGSARRHRRQPFTSRCRASGACGANGENRRTQESLQRVAVLARELVDSLGDVVGPSAARLMAWSP